MFLNHRHLFLASGRISHYFQTSHLSPISTRQLVLMNSPAQPLLVSWDNLYGLQILFLECSPSDNLHTQITPGSLPASLDRSVNLSSFWRRHWNQQWRGQMRVSEIRKREKGKRLRRTRDWRWIVVQDALEQTCSVACKPSTPYI